MTIARPPGSNTSAKAMRIGSSMPDAIQEVDGSLEVDEPLDVVGAAGADDLGERIGVGGVGDHDWPSCPDRRCTTSGRLSTARPTSATPSSACPTDTAGDGGPGPGRVRRTDGGGALVRPGRNGTVVVRRRADVTQTRRTARGDERQATSRARRAAVNRALPARGRVAARGYLDVPPTPAQLIAAGRALRDGDPEVAAGVLAPARRADARRSAGAPCGPILDVTCHRAQASAVSRCRGAARCRGGVRRRWPAGSRPGSRGRRRWWRVRRRCP
jgi:hypothetical protein